MLLIIRSFESKYYYKIEEHNLSLAQMQKAQSLSAMYV